MDLPDIIKHKLFEDELTKEQQIFDKIISKQDLEENDEVILDELIGYYERTFVQLKNLKLDDLTEEDFVQLNTFLSKFYNVLYPVQNKLDFKKLYRVCIVNDDLREKGKIRHPKYISFPELSYLKSRGNLNRASTAGNTLLYASSILNVAIAELKPKDGDYIIVSHWEKNNGDKLNSYPIINCEEEIANDFLKQSVVHFKQMYDLIHPKMVKIIDVNLQFLASEFIKQVSSTTAKGYEYAFSSYYSDKIIKSKEFDCIIYPSVPFEYKADNIAIKPDNIDDYLNITKGIKLTLLEEFKIISIDYSKMDLYNDFYSLEKIRDADWFENDDIIWNDE